MGSDGYVIGDENYGFIIRRNFVTSNICCNMVLVVIILYFIVVMIIFTINICLKCIVPDGTNNI
jgi:hypothetical protein